MTKTVSGAIRVEPGYRHSKDEVARMGNNFRRRKTELQKGKRYVLRVRITKI